jgi:sugar phosphate permease
LRREVVARVIRRIIPFAFICYVVAYIDRVNVGFAAAVLQQDLGLNDAQFGQGAGLFFIGYCLFEVPSNLILDRVGARRWIARILIGWASCRWAWCSSTMSGRFTRCGCCWELPSQDSSQGSSCT